MNSTPAADGFGKKQIIFFFFCTMYYFLYFDFRILYYIISLICSILRREN